MAGRHRPRQVVVITKRWAKQGGFVMNPRKLFLVIGMIMTLMVNVGLGVIPATAASILIHMKTSLAEDDAQICAVPGADRLGGCKGRAQGHDPGGCQCRHISDKEGFGWFRAHGVRFDSTGSGWVA